MPVAQLAPPRSGIISIRYRQVMCTPPGGIRVMATAFNGPERYLRLTFQVRMHSQPFICCGCRICTIMESVRCRRTLWRRAVGRHSIVAALGSVSSPLDKHKCGCAGAEDADQPQHPNRTYVPFKPLPYRRRMWRAPP